MFTLQRGRERARRAALTKAGAMLMAVLMLLGGTFAVHGCAPQPALADVPDSITVATVEPYPDGVMDSGGLTSHRFTDPDGTVLYCADCDAGTPVPGQTFTGRVPGGIVLDYILWYGHGGTGDAGWSQAATQVAVWEHLYVVGDGLNTEGWHRQKQAWPEGKRLYDEAVANASASGPYAGTSWIYGEASKACQRMIGQTARTGSVAIEKASSNPALSDGNGVYRLEGAVFGIYADEACTTEVARVATDASGRGRADGLALGTYWVREISAPHGYALSDTVHKAEVGVTGVTLFVDEVPQSDPLFLSLAKVDAGSGEGTAQGAATLEGAEFTVRYYAGTYDAVDALPSEPTRAWVLKTDAGGRTSLVGAQKDPATYYVGGDTFYTDSDGTATLPLGTVTVQETKAPRGYLLDGTVHLRQINASGTAEHVTSEAFPAMAEQVIRGDLRLVKAEEDSQSRMARIPFILTSTTTGESHVLVTDENGMLDTSSAWNSHARHTNANDAALREDGTVDDALLDPVAGTWFSGGAERTTEPDDSLGALPYDTYDLAELPCAANEGHRLVSTRVTVSRHGVNLDLGTVDDKETPTPEAPKAEISTELTCEGNKTAPADPSVSLADTVFYQGIVSGETYTLEGELHLVSEDEDGQLVDEGTVATASTELVPAGLTGSSDVAFELDTTDMAGKRLVALETVRDKDGAVVAEHADLSDERQTVGVTPPDTEEPLPPAKVEPPAEPTPTPGPKAPEGPLPNTGDPAPVAAVALAATGVSLLALTALALVKSDRRRPEPPTPRHR